NSHNTLLKLDYQLITQLIGQKTHNFSQNHQNTLLNDFVPTADALGDSLLSSVVATLKSHFIISNK
ncbi:MAG: hypothetical protein RPR28_03820, partial [Cycloclasticus sp.]